MADRNGTDAPRRLTQRGLLPRLFRTSAFKFTLGYFVVFMATFAAVGIVVFSTTIDAAMRRLDRELTLELAYLADINQREGGGDGWAGLNAVLNEIARLKVIHRDALYVVVVGPPAQVLTSDLDGLPIEAATAEGMFRFEYDARVVSMESGRIEIEQKPAVGRIGNFLYAGADGKPVRAIILTARDISETGQISDAASAIALRLLIFAPVLALVFGLIFSGAFLRRVDRIGQTVRAIRDGDLTRRVSLTGANDEFDNLSENINAMLDQIERLMTGMRQVSDNIAHDLRSPLTRIKARLEAALADPAADHGEILATTTEDVERLLATFNALLSITRIEAGEGGGSQVPVDVTEVAEEMAELYEPAAADAGFRLVQNIHPTTPILGSRELISQALANLLDNAFKYARHNDGSHIEPMIEVTVVPRGEGGVLLSVMDNGPGVSEADQERILQRFVRLERSRSTMGNGLGLSLVAAIARRHNAQLSIGRGLPQDPERRTLSKNSDYGLGIRLAFPASAKLAKSKTAAEEEPVPANAS